MHFETGRRTGKTFRTTLRALLRASSTPNSWTFIVVPTLQRRRHNLFMLKHIARVASTTPDDATHSVKFANGAVIKVIALDDQEREMEGRADAVRFYDMT